MPNCGDRARFIIDPEEELTSKSMAVCGAHVSIVLSALANYHERITVQLLPPADGMSQRERRRTRLPCERRQPENSWERRKNRKFVAAREQQLDEPGYDADAYPTTTTATFPTNDQ